eukprot:gene16825-18523_t
MYRILEIRRFFGRMYTSLKCDVANYKDVFTWLFGRGQNNGLLFQRIHRLTPGVHAGLVAGTAGLAFAHAQRGGDVPQQDEVDGPKVDTKDWISSRVKGDICHLTPGISELMLDLLDLLQESYDKYVNTMSRRVSDLEGNLRRYTSTMSLNLADAADSHPLTDSGSKQIQQFRKDYRKTYQRVSEMVSGLDRFLLSAGELGANNCLEKCQRQIQEITGLLNDLDYRIRSYENKLEMAEKHFRTKMRRTVTSAHL